MVTSQKLVNPFVKKKKLVNPWFKCFG